MPRVTIDKLVPGTYVEDAVFLLTSVEKRVASNGKAFLTLKLSDRTGSVAAKRWDSTDEEFQRMREADFVRVSGEVGEYNGKIDLTVREWALARGHGLDYRDFLPTTPCDVAELRAKLDKCLEESLGDAQLRALVRAVLSDPRVASKLAVAPAATEFHHAYVGGLLEHVVAMARLAVQVSKLYAELDKDLLIAGAILHDIGKVEELDVGKGFQYSDIGRLKGHIALGVEIVRDAARGVEGLPPSRAHQVEHLILSHHGTKEWGSPVVPVMREAVVLHYLDQIDAKLAGARAAFKEAEADPGRWTGYQKMFGAQLFKGFPEA